MNSGATLAQSILDNMGYEGHIPAQDGDYIGADGHLHCGVCGEGKEYMLPGGRMVPSVCRCQRMARIRQEIETENARNMQYIDEVSRHNLLYSAKLRGATFDRAEQREDGAAAFETARTYVRAFEAICNSEDDLRGLLLYGPVGTGKSFLAGCIGNALKAQGVPVLYVNVVTLTGLDFDEQREVIAHMGGARLLVLDDLGAERDTGFKVETLYNVLDRRVNDMLPLIVTTNATPQEMRNDANMGYRRVWERVGQLCRPVRMDGESWRRRKTMEAMKRLKEG